MIAEYRYAGPDGERIGSLPEETGAAIGSDYCVHLLPSGEALAGAISAASARGAPLLLLTPFLRDAELKGAVRLLRMIPKDADVDVAVNDWGMLAAARALFPWLRISVGRLLSGQKRCPRIAVSDRLTPRGRGWHAEGLFGSERGRAFLSREFGIAGFHIDRLAWEGPERAPAESPRADGGIALWIHSPFSVVTVSDACPWIGGRSSASVASCPRPCRAGAVALREASMGAEMIQKGKARFVERARSTGDGVPEGGGRRLVFYDDVP